jgi:hypothetical protein
MQLGVEMAKLKKRITLPKIGFSGHYEEGERMISDPMEAGARYIAKVNVRESAIAHMASRGRINPSQEAAGERFRKLWEQARIGRSLGIDPAKEAVDGGGTGDPMTDSLLRAGRDLAKAITAVGPVGSKLLMDIVGEGKLIEDVADSWARSGGAVRGRRAEGYVTGRMIEALDDLVRAWALDGKGRADMQCASYLRNGQRIEVVDDIVASGPITVTGPSREVKVGRFGDVEVRDVQPIDRGPMMPHGSDSASARGRGKKR